MASGSEDPSLLQVNGEGNIGGVQTNLRVVNPDDLKPNQVNYSGNNVTSWNVSCVRSDDTPNSTPDSSKEKNRFKILNSILDEKGLLRVVCKQIVECVEVMETKLDGADNQQNIEIEKETSLRTLLSIEKPDPISKATFIYWRTIPSKLGLDITCLKEANVHPEVSNRLELKFEVISEMLYERLFELAILLEFENEDYCYTVYKNIQSSQQAVKNLSKQTGSGTYNSSWSKEFVMEFRLVSEQEKLLQFTEQMKRRDGAAVVEKGFYRRRMGLLSDAMNKWMQIVAEKNSNKMDDDKARWKLHAVSNVGKDLQAWYHAAFTSEIYRLRGSFWYRDAVLPNYKTSYGLVDNNLTPLEEAALSHILCSPGTTYGDVAGQMFTVEAMVGPNLYSLFSSLCSNGSLATKYPRVGRPSKKLFRFSFVEGSIYLTWKGKAGNTGIDLAEVTHVTRGLCSDILRKKGVDTMPNKYLSLFSTGRSVDLFFETETECFDWFTLLEALVRKEKERIYSVLDTDDPRDIPESCEYDNLCYKTVVGL